MDIRSRYLCSYCIDYRNLGLFYQETEESKRATFPDMGADDLIASDPGLKKAITIVMQA
jgi:hypothetical protein